MNHVSASLDLDNDSALNTGYFEQAPEDAPVFSGILGFLVCCIIHFAWRFRHVRRSLQMTTTIYEATSFLTHIFPPLGFIISLVRETSRAWDTLQ